MTPEALLEILFFAAEAKTDEEKARVAWRASAFMWLKVPTYDLRLCRRLNDHCVDQNWPKVDLHITKETVEEILHGKTTV